METPEEISFISILVPVLIVIFVIAIGVFLLNQHFQKNLFLQKLKQEEIKHQHQQELLKSTIQTQEDERRRIARNLHDELGASLSIARMQLVRLEELSEKETDVELLKNTRNITEAALTSVREISHRLMPPQLETLGLVKTLENVAFQVNETDGLSLQLNISPDLVKMPWEVEVGIYRICMELINNTIKHAEANTVQITLRTTSGSAILTYLDDGKGLSDNVPPGLGLTNLEARVNALEGSFAIKRGKGFQADFNFPLDSKRT